MFANFHATTQQQYQQQQQKQQQNQQQNQKQQQSNNKTNNKTKNNNNNKKQQQPQQLEEVPLTSSAHLSHFLQFLTLLQDIRHSNRSHAIGRRISKWTEPIGRRVRIS